MKILAASGLVVLFDVVLELVANKMDFWYWMKDIPFGNYVMWFIVALIMFTIMKIFKVNIENKLAVPMYVTLIVFMLLLSVII